MGWKRKDTSQNLSVYADIDLADFEEVQLVQALIDAKWLSEEEAEAIEKRASLKETRNIFVNSVDDELDEARTQLRRGNKSEALIHLERFLGRDWIGELQ
ncbi:hypothetical protein [Rhizobium johnstonii]|uniref:hypothetical protein n=1 Tax=Rhizobium johnstonii TaxID=3019933 RepID=UPI003F99F158